MFFHQHDYFRSVVVVVVSIFSNATTTIINLTRRSIFFFYFTKKKHCSRRNPKQRKPFPVLSLPADLIGRGIDAFFLPFQLPSLHRWAFKTELPMYVGFIPRGMEMNNTKSTKKTDDLDHVIFPSSFFVIQIHILLVVAAA